METEEGRFLKANLATLWYVRLLRGLKMALLGQNKPFLGQNKPFLGPQIVPDGDNVQNISEAHPCRIFEGVLIIPEAPRGFSPSEGSGF